MTEFEQMQKWVDTVGELKKELFPQSVKPFEVNGNYFEFANRAEIEAIGLVREKGKPVTIINHATGNNKVCFMDVGKIYICWEWNYKGN